MAIVVGVVLMLFGAFQLMEGYSLLRGAESAFHQIYSGVTTLGGIVLLTGGAILASIGHTGSLVGRFGKDLPEVRKELAELRAMVASSVPAVGRPAPAVPVEDGINCRECGYTNPRWSQICRCGTKLS
ncbi:hypothetical protein [Aminobacter niigataensis]|uniref:hypothetical protein n=1 Tax=Aminobacter niigataensis TaxID=83265 RepID=UPI0024C62C54|nr:hypothetical protein [Aminobacter niigataensis]CAI2936125.1 protein of unknown function [Aminobacter niigataensis]